MLSTPRDALIDQIAKAIEADPTLCNVPVKRGFPSSQSRDDDFVLPSISVSIQSENQEKSRRRSGYRETLLPNGNIEVLFEQYRVAISGTVEMWTKDKTEREPLEKALDELFGGELPEDFSFNEPSPPGLVLKLALLYDAKVRVLIVDKNEQDASGARDGYFRVLYSFTSHVPYLTRREYKQATFTADNEVDEGLEVDDC